jgi:hypothetical protein
MQRIVTNLVSVIALIFWSSAAYSQAAVSANYSLLNDSSLVLVNAYKHPVITIQTDKSAKIKYGFEGGRVVKVKDTYHLFTSEMVDRPIWVKMKLGHWTSKDKINWKRVATIRESSGDFTGKDERAAYWSPMPVWDGASNRWHLFYVAYKAAPSDSTAFRGNMQGRIVHAISAKAGIDGIMGPFNDLGIIMKPGKLSGAWEGLQGVDSFFPWKVGAAWYAFHGSCNTEKLPVNQWRVGMATSASLNGPWKRIYEKSPVAFEPTFIENPVVNEIKGRGWICVYDNAGNNNIGWGFSQNGTDWSRGKPIIVAPDSAYWSWNTDVRTALGIVHEGGNRYTIFYTSFQTKPDWNKILQESHSESTCAIGFVEVELK